MQDQSIWSLNDDIVPLKVERALLIRKIIITVGCCLIAIVAGTNNAFNEFGQMISAERGLTSSEMNLIAGLGLLGIYFTVPAGFVHDQLGPFLTSIIGCVLTIVSYLAMTFVPNQHNLWPLLLVCYMLTSFGSGAAWISALGTAMAISPTGGGIPVALASAGMSLSVTFTVYSMQLYDKVRDCPKTNPSCWIPYFRLIAVLLSTIQLVGCFSLFFFRKRDYPHLNEAVKEEDRVLLLEESFRKEKGSTFFTIFKILKIPYFWILFWASFCGIGSSLLVLTQASQMINSYYPLKTNWDILPIFSASNAISNVFVGILADKLASKNIVSHRVFLGSVMMFFSLIFGSIGILFTLQHHEGLYFVVFVLMASAGLGFGCYLVIVPIITIQVFGVKDFGKFFGLIQISSAIASVGLPQLYPMMASHTGSYASCFYFCCGLLVSASLLLFVSRPKKNYEIN